MNWRFESAATLPLSFARSELSQLAENLPKSSLGLHAFSRQPPSKWLQTSASGPNLQFDGAERRAATVKAALLPFNRRQLAGSSGRGTALTRPEI